MVTKTTFHFGSSQNEDRIDKELKPVIQKTFQYHDKAPAAACAVAPFVAGEWMGCCLTRSFSMEVLSIGYVIWIFNFRMEYPKFRLFF